MLMGESYALSPQQWEAVTAPLGPAVVIAGAGSGKTTLMKARVVYLVANGLVAPEQILGLTFTTKAAAELRTRVREALLSAGLAVAGEEDELSLPTVTTYNAYASRLLTEHGLRIGHEPEARVMADATRYQLAARAVARHRQPVRLLSDHPATVIGGVLALDGELNEHLADLDELRRIDLRISERVRTELDKGAVKGDLEKLLSASLRRLELAELVRGYRALKADLGLIDFSDQIALAARLAVEHPDVGASERAQFPVVLLDEYQDTSVAQARLLSGLFSGASVDTGLGHPVMAVGDPHQAIYGWRGASVSNIVGFERSFPAAPGTQVPRFALTINRRSGARILEVANVLAADLAVGPVQVAALVPAPETGPGRVATMVHETYDEELAWLATAVAGAHHNGTPWREIGVLTRDNAHAADVFEALSATGIPVEIVGLRGLLALGEIAEVVATLKLLVDLTQNSALLQLLTSPRWAVGPRDLALLGRRARELGQVAGVGRQAAGVGAAKDSSLSAQLGQAVAAVDPSEVVALSDALESPGSLPYSAEARERFALLAAELRQLRAWVSEPLVDLVRRIVDVSGLDVELASIAGPAAQARRENLDLFIAAVGDFQAVDGDVTLPALVSYLEAEDEQGTGLDLASPSVQDSVKLLTVHRAKGLEYDVVFLPGVADEKFPTKRGRPQWTTSPGVLPIELRGDAHDLPRLPEISAAGLKAFAVEVKEHQAMEELRLGYVAFTRPRRELWVSSYVWHHSRQTPLGPSPYQLKIRDCLARWGEVPASWHDKPERGTPNPLHATRKEIPWPVSAASAEIERRRQAAELVRASRIWDEPPETGPDGRGLDLIEAATVARWDADADRLLAEAMAAAPDVIEVPLPSSLSATALTSLAEDPEGFAAALARPMPRQPSVAARFGTRFHAWVEARFGQLGLFAPDDLPGQADAGIDDDQELLALCQAFEDGPFGDRAPLVLEHAFSLTLAGQVVRGRIDAVYAVDDPDHDFLVVDWKTGRRESADPGQLALYRLAWAELTGTPLERVRAAFYFVGSGVLMEPADLVDRTDLEQLLLNLDPPDRRELW